MTTENQLLREALRKIKYEAVSLGDAQVIALEALTQPAQAGEAVTLVPLATHNRLTMGPAPWTGTRVPLDAWDLSRAIYGTSTEDDDKRLYRSLQGAIYKLYAAPQQQAGGEVVTDEVIAERSVAACEKAGYQGANSRVYVLGFIAGAASMQPIAATHPTKDAK